MSLPSVTTPPDPWTDERFGSTAPRLVTYTHGEPSRHGGVVVLSAALWGGHHERQVRLGVHEARLLGRELVALADALDARSFRERQAARDIVERLMGRDPALRFEFIQKSAAAVDEDAIDA